MKERSPEQGSDWLSAAVHFAERRLSEQQTAALIDWVRLRWKETWPYLNSMQDAVKEVVDKVPWPSVPSKLLVDLGDAYFKVSTGMETFLERRSRPIKDEIRRFLYLQLQFLLSEDAGLRGTLACISAWPPVREQLDDRAERHLGFIFAAMKLASEMGEHDIAGEFLGFLEKI